MIRRRWALAALAFAAIAATPAASCQPLDVRGEFVAPRVLPQNAEIRWVIDGDTVDVLINGTSERVRLLGIDTPETKKPNEPIECFGPQASEYTTALLPPGTAVYLERDIVGRDDYGRLLAYVYRATDGLFVNLDLVRGGYALPLPFRPNDAHAADFAAAARDAQAARVGWWGACAG